MSLSDDSENEWSVLARSYEDNLRPRFKDLYNSIANIVVKQVELQEKNKSKILDYGTGPGEPILTILESLQANKLFNVDLYGTDSSLKMLSIAEDRLNKSNNKQLNIQLFPLNLSVSSDTYDIITMSLVLPYASSKEEMLRERFNQLNLNGVLVSSHWYRYDQVPFLTTIKAVLNYMASETHLDLSTLEFDSSYSCWPEKQTRDDFEKVGFTIQQWNVLSLHMSFPNIRGFLNFCDMCSWFNNETLYAKAEKEAKRILENDFHIQFASDGSFELLNTVIIVVASKSS